LFNHNDNLNLNLNLNGNLNLNFVGGYLTMFQTSRPTDIREENMPSQKPGV